ATRVAGATSFTSSSTRSAPAGALVAAGVVPAGMTEADSGVEAATAESGAAPAESPTPAPLAESEPEPEPSALDKLLSNEPRPDPRVDLVDGVAVDDALVDGAPEVWEPAFGPLG